MNLKTNFVDKFGNSFNDNVNLSNLSWFNLGGNAEYFFKAKNKNQLIEFLKEAKKIKTNITILGAGSNTLIRDNGVKGFVLKLGKEFSYIKKINKDTLEVGSATLDRKVANFAKENSLKNFEFLSCIPGSVGGAIIMNSGCYGNDISKVLVSLSAIDKNNFSEIEIKKEDIKFLYRGSNLSSDLIIISAKLKGSVGRKEEIERDQAQLVEKKNYLNLVKLKLVEVLLKIYRAIKKHGCLLKRRDVII